MTRWKWFVDADGSQAERTDAVSKLWWQMVYACYTRTKPVFWYRFKMPGKNAQHRKRWTGKFWVERNCEIFI